MQYNPNIHHRRSIRLQGYDYAEAGAYFITVTTHRRLCLFGEMTGGAAHMNDAGLMVDRWWAELNKKFSAVETDESVVMPNHFHGIICLNLGEPNHCKSVGSEGLKGAHIGAPLPEIVQRFKTMTTNEYIRGVRRLGWPAFPARLWQRNYYEHIIRSDRELNRLRQYILDNPAKWPDDVENPQNAR